MNVGKGRRKRLRTWALENQEKSANGEAGLSCVPWSSRLLHAAHGHPANIHTKLSTGSREPTLPVRCSQFRGEPDRKIIPIPAQRCVKIQGDSGAVGR